LVAMAGNTRGEMSMEKATDSPQRTQRSTEGAEEAKKDWWRWLGTRVVR